MDNLNINYCRVDDRNREEIDDHERDGDHECDWGPRTRTSNWQPHDNRGEERKGLRGLISVFRSNVILGLKEIIWNRQLGCRLASLVKFTEFTASPPEFVPKTSLLTS